MKPIISQTETGLFISLGGSKPAPKRHRHVWYVDGARGTYCGTCGKSHPTERRQP